MAQVYKSDTCIPIDSSIPIHLDSTAPPTHSLQPRIRHNHIQSRDLYSSEPVLHHSRASSVRKPHSSLILRFFFNAWQQFLLAVVRVARVPPSRHKVYPTPLNNDLDFDNNKKSDDSAKSNFFSKLNSNGILKFDKLSDTNSEFFFDSHLLEKVFENGRLLEWRLLVHPWSHKFKSQKMEDHYMESILLRNRVIYARVLSTFTVLIVIADFTLLTAHMGLAVTVILLVNMLFLAALSWIKAGKGYLIIATRIPYGINILKSAVVIALLTAACLDLFISKLPSDIIGSTAICSIVYCSLSSGLALTYLESISRIFLILVVVLIKVGFIYSQSVDWLTGIIYLIPVICACILSFSYVSSGDRIRRLNYLKTQFVDAQLHQTSIERAKADYLLSVCLPRSIIKKLKGQHKFDLIAHRHENATVMFGELKNFKEFVAGNMSMKNAIITLNYLFEYIDESICQFESLEKIKTISNKFLIVGGLSESTSHLTQMIDMAIALTEYFKTPKQIELDNNVLETVTFKLGFGVESGPLVACIVGKKKFVYEIYGDVVNVSSRYLGIAKVNQIVVSENLYKTLANIYNGEPLGAKIVKGKGLLRLCNIKERHKENSDLESSQPRISVTIRDKLNTSTRFRRLSLANIIRSSAFSAAVPLSSHTSMNISSMISSLPGQHNISTGNLSGKKSDKGKPVRLQQNNARELSQVEKLETSDFLQTALSASNILLDNGAHSVQIEQQRGDSVVLENAVECHDHAEDALHPLSISQAGSTHSYELNVSHGKLTRIQSHSDVQKKYQSSCTDGDLKQFFSSRRPSYQHTDTRPHNGPIELIESDYDGATSNANAPPTLLVSVPNVSDSQTFDTVEKSGWLGLNESNSARKSDYSNKDGQHYSSVKRNMIKEEDECSIQSSNDLNDLNDFVNPLTQKSINRAMSAVVRKTTLLRSSVTTAGQSTSASASASRRQLTIEDEHKLQQTSLEARDVMAEVILRMCEKVEMINDKEHDKDCDSTHGSRIDRYMKVIYNEMDLETLRFKHTALEEQFQMDFVTSTHISFIHSWLVIACVEVMILFLGLCSYTNLFGSIALVTEDLNLYIGGWIVTICLLAINPIFLCFFREYTSRGRDVQIRNIQFFVLIASLLVSFWTVMLPWTGLYSYFFMVGGSLVQILAYSIYHINGITFIYKSRTTAAVVFFSLVTLHILQKVTWYTTIGSVGCIFMVYLTIIRGMRLQRVEYLLDVIMDTQGELVWDEIEKSSRLLHIVLPEIVISQIVAEPSSIVYEELKFISVLFLDIVNFTVMSGNKEPIIIVEMLNTLFSFFDFITDEYNVEKITTIGDAYLACSAIKNDVDPKVGASAVCMVALQMQAYVKQTLNKLPNVVNNFPGLVNIRIGVHSGPCYAAIMGGPKNFRYNVLGDTVDIAERVQEIAPAGGVCITQPTLELIQDNLDFRWELYDVTAKNLEYTYILSLKDEATLFNNQEATTRNTAEFTLPIQLDPVRSTTVETFSAVPSSLPSLAIGNTLPPLTSQYSEIQTPINDICQETQFDQHDPNSNLDFIYGGELPILPRLTSQRGQHSPLPTHTFKKPVLPNLSKNSSLSSYVGKGDSITVQDSKSQSPRPESISHGIPRITKTPSFETSHVRVKSFNGGVFSGGSGSDTNGNAGTLLMVNSSVSRSPSTFRKLTGSSDSDGIIVPSVTIKNRTNTAVKRKDLMDSQ
ncbi:hypothetical protein BDV3_006372 [Batrachochytrium dendrobatidis]